MIKLFQIKKDNSFFDRWPDLWTASNPGHTSYYVEESSGRVVDCSELSFRFGVSNFSTAKDFFEQYEKIQARAAAEYEKDLDIEMRTTF